MLRVHDDVKPVTRILEQSFGIPKERKLGDPLDGLVLTILSQNTNDKNRDRAFERLRTAFPTWEDVLLAGPSSLEKAIHVGGLGRTKAKRIHQLLEDLKRSGHGLTLEGLKGLPPEQAEHFLLAIPGVGKKTARCVLLFELGRPAFPVDTHILRVTRRMGWIPEGASANRAHDLLQEMIPPEVMHSLHLNLIHLGRTLCRPQNPQCGSCPIRNWCRYASADFS